MFYEIRRPVKKKVLAYILREKNGVTEILLHRHRDFHEAGYQVPGGTVEENEAIEGALLREVYEESGLNDFDMIEKIGESWLRDEKNKTCRFFYRLHINKNVPDTFEHKVSGNGEDAGLVFIYEWWDIKRVPELAADQDTYIEFLTTQ